MKEALEKFVGNAEEYALLSHRVRCLYETSGRQLIELTKKSFESEFKLKDAGERLKLPSVETQIDNLILLIGDTLGGALTESEELYFDNHKNKHLMSCVGALNHVAFRALVRICFDEGLVNPFELGAQNEERIEKGKDSVYAKIKNSPLQLSLTYKGWKQYSLLKHGRQGKTAFLAMQFGKDEQSKQEALSLYSALKEVVKGKEGDNKVLGFDLIRIDKAEQAGLIDDIMRTRIRESRFMLSDLTERNQGAYWEGGFAEGLGKPVIYLCRKDVFDNPETKPHFDVNHCTILTWEWKPGEKKELTDDFKERLFACIKNTFARMQPGSN